MQQLWSSHGVPSGLLVMVLQMPVLGLQLLCKHVQQQRQQQQQSDKQAGYVSEQGCKKTSD
jgi:hypothetical protein